MDGGVDGGAGAGDLVLVVIGVGRSSGFAGSVWFNCTRGCVWWW